MKDIHFGYPLAEMSQGVYIQPHVTVVKFDIWDRGKQWNSTDIDAIQQFVSHFYSLLYWQAQTLLVWVVDVIHKLSPLHHDSGILSTFPRIHFFDPRGGYQKEEKIAISVTKRPLDHACAIYG